MYKNYIEINDLTVAYNREPAIHHICCNIPFGKTTAIIGPNGGGKTTLLKAIARQAKIETGTIKYHCYHNSPSIAYLNDNNEFNNSICFSVLDIVKLGFIDSIGLYKGINKIQNEQALQALHDVSMYELRHKYIDELSLGQLQRVKFAKIIASEADIILLDEPFNGVDIDSIELLIKTIFNWQTLGKSVIIVLHDIQIAKTYFAQSIILAKELIAYGKTSDVINELNMTKAYKNYKHIIKDVCTPKL